VKQYLEQGLPIPKGAKRQRTIPSLYHYAEREMRENEEIRKKTEKLEKKIRRKIN